ncbi:BTB/POZ domain-containing protein KCTD17-like [Lytechinus variegatus]|uniref:BTB/POZ domain-containing protein KCTD17-like n=1 Tax=Lytechinus variegatus TaxID=7654 RepID=UPI001BB1C562|nr:BTB/POZ domain-containing protein KCTD17-like [Lytechinus variegatus]
MTNFEPGDYVTLSVGGVEYTTTVLTLTSFTDSMLGGMFSGRIEAKRDHAKGHYLIDRDGELFRYVLNFLRNRTLGIPEDFKQLHMLLLEAEFYQIEPMCDALRQLLQKPDPEVIEIQVRSFQDANQWSQGVWKHEGSKANEFHRWKIYGLKETLGKVSCLESILIKKLKGLSTTPQGDIEKGSMRLEFLETAFHDQTNTPEGFGRSKMFLEIGMLGFTLKATDTHWPSLPHSINNYTNSDAYRALWQQWIFTRV